MTGPSEISSGADRAQLQWDMLDLESLLAIDHRARIVWGFVESLDLSALYDAIGAREGEPGVLRLILRFLMALWLYATIEGWARPDSLRGSAQRRCLPLAGRWRYR